MTDDFWTMEEILEEAAPPLFLGVPGAMLGIEVPFLPKPGRLHIIAPYQAKAFVDRTAMRGMRWACRIDDAAAGWQVAALY